MAKENNKKQIASVEIKTASATLRYLKISPRKVRIVANVLKNRSISEAEAQMMLHDRRAALPILKLLRSAIANAKAKGLDITKLVIKDIRVDQGPMLKRWMPRAQGRATPIHKTTSHLVIVLQEGLKSVQSRFVTEIKKVKKEKKGEHTHSHQHEHEHENESEEAKKKTKEVEVKEIKKEPKASQDKGFVQKVFRRKSI